jgi:hypothetical protein
MNVPLIKTFWTACAAVALLSLSTGLRAADAFASAESVAMNTTVTASNSSATNQLGEPQGIGYKTIWYKCQAASNGIVKVDTPQSPAIGIDHVVSVFRGSSLTALELVGASSARSWEGT